MIIQESMTLKRKLEILSDAAKYDVACTSSGVDRKGSMESLDLRPIEQAKIKSKAVKSFL